MPNWVIKAAAQRAIGFLPARHVWNGALQARIARTVTLDEGRFTDKLHRVRGHLQAYREHGRAGADPGRAPARVVEIGTGWFPIAPVAFWLCGADAVLTLDVTRHLTEARFAATLVRFAAFHRDGRLAALLPGIDPARACCLAELAAAGPGIGPLGAMEGFGLHYRVCEAPAADLPEGCADLVFTTAVLEYLPYTALVALLRESGRLLAPEGCTSHWIDLSDEYAYFDARITPFNFLRFSDRAWRVINNPIIPLSRLRIGDYRRAFAEAGLRIVREEPRRGAASDLARVPVAAEFRRHPADDLLVLDAWVTAVPAAPRTAIALGAGPRALAGSAAAARRAEPPRHRPPGRR